MQGFVPILLQHLKSDDIIMATQACRALGNICFENGGYLIELVVPAILTLKVEKLFHEFHKILVVENTFYCLPINLFFLNTF